MIKIFKKILGITTRQDKKTINSREALTKESCMAMSTATMMILTKSHPVRTQLPAVSIPKLNQYAISSEYLRTALG